MSQLILLSAITLRSIIDEHMCSIGEQDRSLIKPFSLYVMKGVLDAVSTLHQKGWAHHDLHGRFNEPRCEKTGLRGFRPGPTQTYCTAREDG